MYELFYNLKAEPFRLSPDHRFCFNHRSYAKAKSYMQYAFRRAEGFVMITGRPGTGKTTLVNDLVDSLSPSEVSVAMLVSTQLDANDLLRMVAYSFGLDGDLPHKAMTIQKLTRLLTNHYKEGRRALLIIDEAQDLSVSALEELRLLTNLQLNSQPLLQIFLLGQEELKNLVHGPNMEQVHQRLVAAYDLEALKENETKQYIKHRLDQVGWKGDPAISEAAFPIIHKFSGGIPRRINLFCSRLFLHGSVEERHKLGILDTKVVLHELKLENLSSSNLAADIDFDIPDEYETAEPDKIEDSSKAELPVQNIQQPQHTDQSEQRSSQTRMREKDLSNTLAENRITGTGNQQNNTNKKQKLKEPATNHKVKSERPAKSADNKSSASKQVNKPDDVDKNSQTIGKGIDAEIDALSTGLDGLSDNVDNLLDKNRGHNKSVDKIGSSDKTRNKFVTLALLVTVSLMLGTVLLFATTSKTLDGKINAAGNWLDGISERVDTLFNRKAELEEKTKRAETKSVAITPNNKIVSSSKMEKEVLQLAKEVKVEQRKNIEEDISIQRVVESTDERINALSGDGNSSGEEEIHSPVEVQQVEKSMKQNEDSEPVNAHLPTDMMANVSIQQVENDELGVEPDKIDEQSADVNVNQKDDEEPSDNTAVKEQVTGGEPVKKLFFKFDSVDIETDYLAELKEVAGQLDASPETSALIIGYSDNVGDKNYNLTLSMKRARAVASFLASQDISTNRLRTDGRGIYPGEIGSESNSEETVSDLSRMVEIYLIPAVNQE